MANIKTQIKLSRGDRTTLREYISSGTHSAKLIRRAQVILALQMSRRLTEIWKPILLPSAAEPHPKAMNDGPYA